MILTLTPNPALDYTIRVDAFELGKRAMYRDPAIDPSGKGINVSRMVRRLGEPTLALGFVAGATGALLREGLDHEGVPHDFVPVSGRTRINVTLLTGADGAATHLRGTGDRVSTAEIAKLLDLVARRLGGAKLLVLSGSLPPGMTPDAVTQLVELARRKGVRMIVDAEGEPLAAAVAAKADLVKPNALEAGQLLGRTLKGVEAVASAAKELVSRGAGAVVITMRGDGAVASAGGKSWHVQPPREEVVRAIGAGDSFAAGLAAGLSRGLELPEALKLAAAAGAATALHGGSGLGSPEEVTRLLAGTTLRPL